MTGVTPPVANGRGPAQTGRRTGPACGGDLVTDTDYQSYPHIYKVGRVLNVVLDSLTIVLVFLLAQRLFRPSAGLVAAALYALAVLPIHERQGR